MADLQDDNLYADELVRRFEEFTGWAIANWPHKNYPLLESDFAEARREISVILGSRLQEGQSSPSAGLRPGEPQYIDTNPMPWP